VQVARLRWRVLVAHQVLFPTGHALRATGKISPEFYDRVAKKAATTGAMLGYEEGLDKTAQQRSLVLEDSFHAAQSSCAQNFPTLPTTALHHTGRVSVPNDNVPLRKSQQQLHD
jgi:hypothetical protein